MSTNSTSFYTGILWDVDDSSDSYYSCQSSKIFREDLIFVTKSNRNNQGAYGIYDYEIKVPANLRSYKGSTETITFYYELK